MVEDLKQYKGKSGSSCPNVGEWLEAFGDADEVFGITISKHLSGSYNAARHAADTYMAEHPARKAFIFDIKNFLAHFCSPHQFFSFGSKASRRPSPNRLNTRIITLIISAGAISRWG